MNETIIKMHSLDLFLRFNSGHCLKICYFHNSKVKVIFIISCSCFFVLYCM